jgi:hypothetical protein
LVTEFFHRGGFCSGLTWRGGWSRLIRRRLLLLLLLNRRRLDRRGLLRRDWRHLDRRVDRRSSSVAGSRAGTFAG